MKDEKLDYFKKLILEHLESLEADKKELKKSLLEAESIAKGGKGLPVGTVRDWKGRKYIKVAPGKWKPKYDSHSRGAKLSIAALKRKADACRSSEELLQLVLENRERFSDEMGRPLPFVKELSDYISAKNDELETPGRKETAEKEPKQDDKMEIDKLLKEVNPDGGKDKGFQFAVKDLEHLKNIKKMIDDYTKNPVKEHEREFEEAKVRQYNRESNRLQEIYNKTGDKTALEGAWKNLDLELFHQWQIAKLDKAKYSKDFNNLTDMLKNGKDFTVETNKYFGNVLIEGGKTGKGGYGIKHIIEQRYKKDGKSVDEITAMIPLILDSIRTGKITRETGRTIELQKNGIVAILRREPNDKGTNWILTGFENTDNAKEKKKAADVIATVIANKDYAPERSSFREQVGAVTALLDNIPQNEKKTSAKADSSMGVTYNGKEIKPTFDTDDTHKEAIAKAEYNNDVENPVLFIPSSKTLDKTIRRMMKCRSKDESRQFITEFGTCGDGFLYATDGRVLQRIKVDGIGGLGNTGSKMQCLKLEQVKGGWKVTEYKGIDKYGNTEVLQYPDCPRVIPRNNTQKATINNNAFLDKIKELDSKGYFSFDQFGEPTNRKGEQVKRLPIDVKADGLYIGSVKVGESNGIESEQKLYLNSDYIKNALQDRENTNLAFADTKDRFLKAISISSSVGDSIIMPMAAGDNEMPVDDFENSSYGKAYQEFKTKLEEKKKRMKKSFDLFGNEIDEPVNRNEERTAKELVADILSGIA